MTRSLRIGSTALGWQEFGAAALLGTRTKVMPGGDGSLDFTVPGDFAWQHRNVIVPEAEVVLTVDGETDFGGYLVCDPLRHRLGAQDTLELAAAGPWGMAARSNRYAYLGLDTDLDRWQQYRGVGEHSGRFTVEREGKLELRASSDRSYGGSDAVRLYCWLMDGLFTGLGGVGGDSGAISGIDFEYKYDLASARWHCGIAAASSPVAATTGLFVWGPIDGPGTETDWTAAAIDVNGVSVLGSTCLMLELYTDDTGLSPLDDCFVRIRWNTAGGVRGRWITGSPPTADRSVSVADILADCAAALGVATTRISGLTTVPDEFVARYPSTIADVIAQATLAEASPVEAYFDHTGSAFRFTANARPTSVDLTRNRLWSVGGRAGEDLSGLQRDWEATPEQVEVLYAVKDDATVPDGMVKAARYPASTTTTFPLVETVDVSGEAPRTAAAAALYAEMVYADRQQNLYAGDVALPETALTSTGQEVPTVKLRPGDRLGAPSLLDVPVAGLYMQGVSYDFRSGACAATVGEPWDPLGFRSRTASMPAPGSGAHYGKGSGRGRGYLRRSGVV